MIKDIEKRYNVTLAIKDLFNYLEYLYRNSIKATVYLKARPGLKARFVKDWKRLPRGG